MTPARKVYIYIVGAQKSKTKNERLNILVEYMQYTHVHMFMYVHLMRKNRQLTAPVNRTTLPQTGMQAQKSLETKRCIAFEGVVLGAGGICSLFLQGLLLKGLRTVKLRQKVLILSRLP